MKNTPEIEMYITHALIRLIKVNKLLNKVQEQDPTIIEVQNNIAEAMNLLRVKYLGYDEEE